MAKVGPAPAVIIQQPGNQASTHVTVNIPDYMQGTHHPDMQNLAPHSTIALVRTNKCCDMQDVNIYDSTKQAMLGYSHADDCYIRGCEGLNIHVGGSGVTMRAVAPGCECFFCSDRVIMYIESPTNQRIGSFVIRDGICGIEYFIKDAAGNIVFSFQPAKQCGCGDYCGDCDCSLCCSGSCCSCCCELTTYLKVFDAAGSSVVGYIRRVYNGFFSCDNNRRYFVDYFRPNEPVGNKGLILATCLIMDFYNIYPRMVQHQYVESM